MEFLRKSKVLKGFIALFTLSVFAFGPIISIKQVEAQSAEDQALLFLGGETFDVEDIFGDIYERLESTAEDLLEITARCAVEQIFIQVINYLYSVIITYITAIFGAEFGKNIIKVPVSEGDLRKINHAIAAKDVGAILFGIPIAPSLDGIGNCITDNITSFMGLAAERYYSKGLGGNTFWIQNYDKYYGKISDEIFARYMEGIEGGKALHPHRNIGVGVGAAVTYLYEQETKPGAAVCTALTGSAAEKRFMNGEFGRGSWETFDAMAFVPECDPVNLTNMVAGDLIDTVDAKMQSAIIENENMSGTQSVKDADGDIETDGNFTREKSFFRSNLPEERAIMSDEGDEIPRFIYETVFEPEVDKIFEKVF